ncbi:MAG: hypothetical protein ACOYKD_02395 [Anaerolineaceae bacterium]|jgi:hypothetical protein
MTDEKMANNSGEPVKKVRKTAFSTALFCWLVGFAASLIAYTVSMLLIFLYYPICDICVEDSLTKAMHYLPIVIGIVFGNLALLSNLFQNAGYRWKAMSFLIIVRKEFVSGKTLRVAVATSTITFFFSTTIFFAILYPQHQLLVWVIGFLVTTFCLVVFLVGFDHWARRFLPPDSSI